jgi:hypothetical protein
VLDCLHLFPATGIDFRRKPVCAQKGARSHLVKDSVSVTHYPENRQIVELRALRTSQRHGAAGAKHQLGTSEAEFEEFNITVNADLFGHVGFDQRLGHNNRKGIPKEILSQVTFN